MLSVQVEVLGARPQTVLLRLDPSATFAELQNARMWSLIIYVKTSFLPLPFVPFLGLVVASKTEYSIERQQICYQGKVLNDPHATIGGCMNNDDQEIKLFMATRTLDSNTPLAGSSDGRKVQVQMAVQNSKGAEPLQITVSANHTVEQLKNIARMKWNLLENDEDDYVPFIPEGGRKALYSPFQIESELPPIIFWETTPSGYRRLNVEKWKKN